MPISITEISRSKTIIAKDAKDIAVYALTAAFSYLAWKIISKKVIPCMFSKLFDRLKALSTETLGLTKRYGENSWAFITDGSNSLGKSFIHELAREGFNIIAIVKDNNESASDYKNSITEKFNIAYEIIQADLSLPNSYENIVNIIEEKNINISMLVNNTVYYNPSSFRKLENEDIFKSIKLNCLLPILLENYFLKIFERRNHKSAIINICDNWKSNAIFKSSIIDTASKRYLRDYTLNSLNNEKIDILCYEPDLPYMQIIHNGITVKVNYGQSSVSGVLYDLGKKSKTDGKSHKRWEITITEQRQN
ncbi:unnamed protein product [Blepharisma stoltei]|uniref:Uncharacterized protein n=1 Tax=Blepharisma stoltei TaxID=1481888 RepID=A0AAU9IV56_9CILI|nr:unnamed protein product [Blepharisma stoltei]